MDKVKINVKHRLPLGAYYGKEFVEDEKTNDIKGYNDIITFIVGGTTFQTLRSNFAYWPTTRLSQLVRANGTRDVLRFCDKVRFCPKTGQHKYTFNRSGNNFNSILDMS